MISMLVINNASKKLNRLFTTTQLINNWVNIPIIKERLNNFIRYKMVGNEEEEEEKEEEEEEIDFNFQWGHFKLL